MFNVIYLISKKLELLIKKDFYYDAVLDVYKLNTVIIKIINVNKLDKGQQQYLLSHINTNFLEDKVMIEYYKNDVEYSKNLDVYDFLRTHNISPINNYRYFGITNHRKVS